VPAISIDTFFACSLMVLLALSAMTSVSKLLYPYINSSGNENIAERYREISKYLLLSGGKPSNWGQNGEAIPETFGLAKADSNPYELDVDKVSRLNNENLYAITYAQIFSALKMSDVSFRIEVKTIFEVAINLASIYESANETTYQFEILTEKYGISVQAELKCYVVAENYLETNYTCFSNGRTYVNVTLPNDVGGPALLIAFAKATCNSKIVSFGLYAFAHNSGEPQPRGTFLRLSPLNYTLNASFIYPEINLSNAYALTFNYYSILTQTESGNQSVKYSIPHFLDVSPILIIVAGRNLTSFFIEWTAYPQVPLQIGADFASSTALSNVLTFTYTVTVNSVFYECRVLLGGPRE